MKKIITISREFGSGGHLVGELVAKKLGYKFFDKQLIDMAAEESGLSPHFIEKSEQSLSSVWVYNMMFGSNYSSGNYNNAAAPSTLPLVDQIFNAQRKVILKIAKEAPCVIVGRCADYVLRVSNEFDNNDILNVFIYADEAAKIERAIKEFNTPEKDAKKNIAQINKRRANHYNTFTEYTWGERSNYELLINSAFAGIENTAKIIADYAQF